MSDPSMTTALRIAAHRGPWCVSIYGEARAWLRGDRPTEVARVQIREAIDRLHAAGAPEQVETAVRLRLEAIATRSDAELPVTDPGIRSIGIFASDAAVDVIPFTTTTTQVELSDRFLIAPLLGAVLDSGARTFVLALSEHAARLIDATAHPPQVIDVPDLPRDLRSTVRLDLTGDRETLAHLRTSEDPKERLHEYAAAVDAALRPVLEDGKPRLVIAAAEPLQSIYRAATGYAAVAEVAIQGNHDEDSPIELAGLAAPVIDAERARDHAARMSRLAEAPRDLVLEDAGEIESATRVGAVDTLFIDLALGGPDAPEAAPIDGDRSESLLRDALSHRVRIVPVEPGDAVPGGIAALLRYPRWR